MPKPAFPWIQFRGWVAFLLVTPLTVFAYLIFLSPEAKAQVFQLELTERWLFAGILFVQLLATLFVFRPISRKIEREIDRREEAVAERFKILARATNDAVWDWDLLTNRVWWGEGIQSLFGYSPEEVSPDVAWWEEHLHPDDKERVLSGIRGLIESGEQFWSDEYRYLRADATYAYVFDRGYVMHGPGGKPFRMIGTMLDITHRKRDEETQRKMTTELARSNAQLASVTQELRKANNRLRRLALLDPLTELFNRRGLEQVLSREIHWAIRSESDLSAALIDLDDFKRFNDTLGHAVGDVILKETARRLKTALRATDHVARIGGDEFMVLLPQTRLDEGIRVAEKIRLSISETPITLSSGLVKVTASLGLVEIPHGELSTDALLSQAHSMLYRSKQSGKNRVSYNLKGETSRGQIEAGKGDVLGRLRQGDCFHAVAQPIFRLETEEPVGYELLSRSSIEGFEMPDDFFRVSFEANMLTLVDHQCFKTCFAAAASLPGHLRKHLNLFPSTILNIPIWILLEELPADASRGIYCIEVSEQQILGDPSHLVEPIKALKRSGILIAIDDVGFGSSCLESLILLEPELIKIDKRCVNGLTHSHSRLRSLERLLKLTQGLGAEVVAEGVETAEDLEVLKSLGVPYGQGFFWKNASCQPEEKQGNCFSPHPLLPGRLECRVLPSDSPADSKEPGGAPPP
ncbi:MAG: diguanylate cyclase [Candidatus Omnitrophica bacterium]|nr:diguanylate cyclase [Candidatus Omnitrophota bacterium]